MTTTAQNTKPLPAVPYRGIESFRYIDQRVFCAREDETWDLLSNILINRGVLLYGDSGSGKSSLVNAGLIPAAIKEKLFAHRLRVQPLRGREIKVERISTETDDKPPYLPSCLADSTQDNAASFEISLFKFYRRLIRLRRGRIEARPLLIFDQFEEFITLFEETSGQAADRPKVQADILKVLTRILQDERFPVKILFVFREEYLAKLNILFKSAPQLLDHYVRLLPPRVDEAEEIILAPFVDEDLKQRFAGKVNHVRDLEHLARTIASQIQQRSENGFINLTELQIVCRKLWESTDPARYFESNNSDIQKVLENYWADALKKLGDLYDPAIALLGHLVTSTNTRNIVSEPDLKVFEKDNFTEERIDAALKALVESRLVRREPRHNIYFYEIVSEFLVPWIREKKTARLAQIQAERLAAQTKVRLKQVEKERRYLSIGSVLLILLLIAAGILSYFTYTLYQKQKTLAQSQKETVDALEEEKKRRISAEDALQTLSDLSTGTDSERLAAINKLIELDRQGNLERSFIPFIVTVVANDKSPAVTKVGSYFYDSLKELTEVQSSNTEQKNVSTAIVEAAEKNNLLIQSQQTISQTPRVYFQLANESQRPRADKLAAALRSIKFIVPAYEIVGPGRSPKTGELRWYKPASDGDLQSVTDKRDQALQVIRQVDGSTWESKDFTRATSARPNHFELWFGADRGSSATQSPSPSPVQSPTVSPSPSSENVVLRLTFVDEQGNQLTLPRFRVSLKSTTQSDAPAIGGASDTLSAPPGIYVLTVRAPGYNQYSQKIVLRGSKVEPKITLKRAPIYQPQ